ncbi:MAG TPA: cytochrome c peroxidase, partial [Pirellulaceae bacterium]|nr:cytochrome c peroxidase [Pirellulaceae bacterium]
MVLNQRAGTMSLVDMADRTTKYETPLGKKPADLVLSSDRKWMLIPDETAHELLIVDWIAAGDKQAVATSSTTASEDARPQLRVRERVAVSPYPVSVSLSRDERRCFVASLWSRRLTEIELPTGDRPAKIVRVIDLPLAPRKLALVRDDSKLIVNDAFGGRLVVVDTASGKLDGAVREFPAHNIRGISVTPDGNTLVLAHQMLNELAHTIRNDVHWGLLMSNDLRWLKVDKILEGGKDLFAGGHMHPLGHAGSATADPAGVAFAPNGKVFVALSGVGEVAIGNENDFSLNRVASGKRPVAITVTKDSKQALVANMFGDSVSVIDVENYEKSHEIPLGPPGELTLVDRGELLFYDGGLSHDGWMSCHSCHTDGHTNGQMNDNFSDKSFGAPKRVLSLLGRADTAPFAWNGSSATLPEQIRKSLTITMQMNKEPSEKQLEALSAYVASLESPPSIDKLRGTFDEKAVERGRGLFTKEG